MKYAERAVLIFASYGTINRTSVVNNKALRQIVFDGATCTPVIERVDRRLITVLVVVHKYGVVSFLNYMNTVSFWILLWI
jgi:hypothetical protein